MSIKLDDPNTDPIKLIYEFRKCMNGNEFTITILSCWLVRICNDKINFDMINFINYSKIANQYINLMQLNDMLIKHGFRWKFK